MVAKEVSSDGASFFMFEYLGEGYGKWVLYT